MVFFATKTLAKAIRYLLYVFFMCLAIPGRIISIEPDSEPHRRMGKVEFGGVKKNINLAFVPDAKPDEYVLVHVGFALQTIDEKEAGELLDFLREMEELDELTANSETS